VKRRTTLSAIFALSSALGRGIAVVLMIVGVGAIGLLAASLASFFLERRGGVQPERSDLREVLERLDGSSANSTGTGSVLFN
jgi:threonine dehydrogenase-like Zn-dependent dehydrogenase